MSPASPRSAIEHFLSLARAGRYDDATTYLDVADSIRTRGPVLARQLKAVLDRHLWVDLDRTSPLAVGDTTDGLPPRLEQLGTIGSPGGVRAPIRLVRSAPGVEPSWRFARSTVDLIPGLYAALDDRWILEHLPAVLLRPGPLELLRWQWLALPVLLAVAVLVGSLASRPIRAILGRVVARTTNCYRSYARSNADLPELGWRTAVVCVDDERFRNAPLIPEVPARSRTSSARRARFRQPLGREPRNESRHRPGLAAPRGAA